MDNGLVQMEAAGIALMDHQPEQAPFASQRLDLRQGQARGVDGGDIVSDHWREPAQRSRADRDLALEIRQRCGYDLVHQCSIRDDRGDHP